MEHNKVKEQLLKGIPSIGSWIQFGHPGIAELMSSLGFDWLAADCEHTDIGIAEFTNLARGMYGRKCTPLARVKENNTLAIRQVLDMGAMGVVVPLVNSAEDAQRAVASAKFPPIGIRGFAFYRANNYGGDFDEYASMANDETLVIVMIETKTAVENIEEILKVEGVDGVFIGPYDMSGSYGMPGRTNDPMIINACRMVLESCKKHGKAAGLHIVLPTEETINNAIREGYTFIGLGMDNVFLKRAAGESLEIVRKSIMNKGV